MTEGIYTFTLPDIGEGVVEGEVIEWLKKVGEPVKKDEPVVVVMTDKATVELPAPYPGTIEKQYYQPGEISIKDKPLYDIRLEAGVSATNHHHKKSEPTSTSSPERRKEERVSCAHTRAKPCTGATLAIPKVRKLADELGIDLASVTPTGKHGEVTLHDLQHKQTKEHKKVPTLSLEGDEELPLIGIQGLMARKMDRPFLPQFSYFEQVDVTRLVQLREKSKAIALQEGISLSYMPFLMRAMVLVIKQHPLLNSSIDMERQKIIVHKAINIGTAMATPHGLIVPVLKGLEKMNLKEIGHAFDELKKRAKSAKLTNADMQGGTITLSNYGAVGDGRWATPHVSPPEVAILAVARIIETPVVREGLVVVRKVLNLSWSFDHRVIDGELAANISAGFSKLLKDPAQLV